MSNDERDAAIDAELDRLGLDYGAEFVPLSKSRNAGKVHRTLNWRVYLTRHGGAPFLVTDYQQGTGHIPAPYRAKHPGRLSVDEDSAEAKIAETGWLSGGGMVRQPMPLPRLRDVMYCLLLDSDAYGRSFTDWVGELGYDMDSRKAESEYRECAETGRKLAGAFTPAELDALRDLFQDY